MDNPDNSTRPIAASEHNSLAARSKSRRPFRKRKIAKIAIFFVCLIGVFVGHLLLSSANRDLLSLQIANVRNTHQPEAASSISRSITPTNSDCQVTKSNGPSDGSKWKNRGLLVTDRSAAWSDPWNIKNALGSVKQCLGAGTVTTTVNLKGIRYKKKGPAGYSEIATGDSNRGEPECLGVRCHPAPFPMLTSTFIADRVQSTTNVKIGAIEPATAAYDLSYDLFIESLSTSKPSCLEVMIDQTVHGLAPLPVIGNTYDWLDPFNNSNSPELFNTQIVWNGRRTNSNWLSYSGYGGDECPLVVFILRSPGQQLGSEIGLSLSSFVKEALHVHGGMPANQYQVMGVEFGAEYGRSIFADSNVHLTWSINRFDVHLGSQILHLLP